MATSTIEEKSIFSKQKTKNKREGIKIKNFIIAMLFLFPSLFLFTVFLFYPLVKTIYLSTFLTNPRGEASYFMGLQHYFDLMKSGQFQNSMMVNLKFSLITVGVGVFVALFLSIICDQKMKGIGIYRTIFSLTMGISIAAGATIFLFLFHPAVGFFNNLLTKMNMVPINWLTDPKVAIYSVSATTIWMNTGFGFMVLSAGLKNIPEELYESCAIDGASNIHKVFHVTLPMLSPSIFYLVVVSIINSLQSFGQIDILTNGGPSESTNLIVYSIYKEAFNNYHYGLASAQAIILFSIVLIVTLVQFSFERKVHYK